MAVITDVEKFREAAKICRDMAESYDELANLSEREEAGEVIPEAKTNEVIGKFVVLASKMKSLE